MCRPSGRRCVAGSTTCSKTELGRLAPWVALLASEEGFVEPLGLRPREPRLRERFHRFIRDLQAGNVWVNTYLQTRYELPFGGFKDSGYGHDTVLEFTREKAAVIAL
jgi:hypothetical protein